MTHALSSADDITLVTEGNYRFSVVATDLAGHTSNAVSETFTLDTHNTLTASVEADSGHSGYVEEGVLITNDASPIFSGKGEAGDVVTLTIQVKGGGLRRKFINRQRLLMLPETGALMSVMRVVHRLNCHRMEVMSTPLLHQISPATMPP